MNIGAKLATGFLMMVIGLMAAAFSLTLVAVTAASQPSSEIAWTVDWKDVRVEISSSEEKDVLWQTFFQDAPRLEITLTLDADDIIMTLPMTGTYVTNGINFVESVIPLVSSGTNLNRQHCDEAPTIEFGRHLGSVTVVISNTTESEFNLYDTMNIGAFHTIQAGAAYTLTSSSLQSVYALQHNPPFADRNVCIGFWWYREPADRPLAQVFVPLAEKE